MTDIKKIHAALHEPFEVKGSLLHMGVRIGVAVLNDDSINAITLVQQAEQAMFKVKKQGGNTIAVFDESMHRNAIDRKNLEIALRDAVEKNALTVYYQPKVDIEKNDVAGCEALGLQTVSEGVEEKNQPAFLVRNGAHIIQGYLFSKPLSAEDCGAFLRNRKARIADVMEAA